MKTATLEDRFWSKVHKIPGGCWEWMGSRHVRGYGEFWDGKTMRRAHRFSWEAVNGPIPAGMNALHHCDNPPCVNPSHLFIGDQSDNMKDCSAKGRMQENPGQSRKTHCKNGHPFNKANVTIRMFKGKIHRRCRPCEEKRKKARDRRSPITRKVKVKGVKRG